MMKVGQVTGSPSMETIYTVVRKDWTGRTTLNVIRSALIEALQHELAEFTSNASGRGRSLSLTRPCKAMSCFLPITGPLHAF